MLTADQRQEPGITQQEALPCPVPSPKGSPLFSHAASAAREDLALLPVWAGIPWAERTLSSLDPLPEPS